MKIYYLNFLMITFLFASCKEVFKKEIPSNSIFYDLAKQKQKQLGLDSLESGFDGIKIRVWYEFSLTPERKLVVLTNKDSNWTATIYYLQVDWDGENEKIISKKIMEVTPKSGWIAFSKKILDLRILTLPNQKDVPGYKGGLDGATFNVEIATKNQYRFYGYWAPDYYEAKFWQAKNMADILNLLQYELDV